MSGTGGSSTGSYCQMARQSLQHNRPDEAVILLKQAVAQDPTNGEAYQLLGLALTQKGLLDDAVSALSTAVGLAPQSAETHYALAMAYRKAGNAQPASAELGEALRLNPAHEPSRQAMAALQAPAYAAAPAPMGPIYGPPAGPVYGAPPSPAYGPYAPVPYGAAVVQPVAGPDTGGWSMENVFQLLFEPKGFISDQVGRCGIGAPIAFFCIHLEIFFFLAFLTMYVGAVAHGAPAGALFNPLVIAMVLVMVFGLAVGLVMAFAGAALAHLGVMMFKGRWGYAATFRALVYSVVPTTTASLVLLALTMALPDLSPAWRVLQLAAYVWGLGTFMLGLYYLNELSPGAAIVSGLIPFVVYTALAVLWFLGMLAFLRPTFGVPSFGPSAPSFGSPGFGRDPFGGSGFGAPSGPQFGQPSFPGFPSGPGGPPSGFRMGPMGPPSGFRSGPRGF